MIRLPERRSSGPQPTSLFSSLSHITDPTTFQRLALALFAKGIIQYFRPPTSSLLALPALKTVAITAPLVESPLRSDTVPGQEAEKHDGRAGLSKVRADDTGEKAELPR